jgi:glycerate kinase
MNILIAPDKFKGSLTAQQVCKAIGDGIQDIQPSWSVVKSLLADGGEGTCEILTTASGGKMIKVKARDPLFREIETSYGLSQDGTVAFIEMARASGLQLLKPQERNPRLTSSIGTGDLITDALSGGVSKIIVGCGGSATNDGGIGMASALGVSFLDASGEELSPIGDSLMWIHAIHTERINKKVSTCKFMLLNDVDNPLTGLKGAAFVYGKQKGATNNDIIQLDAGLKNFAQVLERSFSGATNFPGAGAAGGFPVSAKAFLKAEIKSGIEFVIDFSRIEEKIRVADLVITGEGKFDNQSLHGKVVAGVARLCRQYQKRLWLVCGVDNVPEREWREMGIEKVIQISSGTESVEYSIENAARLIREKISDAIAAL